MFTRGEDYAFARRSLAREKTAVRDLAGMLHGRGREEDIPKLTMMRRLIELEQGLHRGIRIER